MKRRTVWMVLAVSLLLLACGQPTAAPAADGAPSRADLERIQQVENGLIPVTPDGWFEFGNPKSLAERMEHHGVPGVGIAVIDGGQLAWAKGYGLLEAGGDAPVTAESLFHAGSIAKPVSAAAALILVERGLLDLDGDVNEKLVSWHVPENEYTVEEKVTLRRLLSHSSGLTDGFPMRSSSDPEYDWGRAGEGERPSATIPQLLEGELPMDGGEPTRVTQVPGTTYQYANLGYGVVQLLMADVTNQPFAALMEATVLGPIGMASSTFEQPLPETLRVRATSEHYVNGEPFEGKRHHFPLQAAGGLWTTPSDLARFAVAIIQARSGELDGFLSQAMAKEMLSPQIQVDDSLLYDAYGLGFDLAEDGQAFRIMHSGGTWGSTSLLWIHPETGQGAVIMTNSASGDGAIRFEVLLSIAAAYGWPLTLLPFDLIDLPVVAVANLYNLLMAAIFFTRPRGWVRFERITGLIMVALALPLTAAVVLNLLANRAWWFVILPIPLILHCLAELLLDYVLKVEFRRSRLLGPYLALFYLGQWGLIGYAFVAEPIYGFVTLATYFLCLGATRYAHVKGVG
ncbi:MAG: serine hydrolase domain-containing protein [Anaerolineae bacterium]|jgi:CubicO group peptidase (beta-lactamase class C family)